MHSRRCVAALAAGAALLWSAAACSSNALAGIPLAEGEAAAPAAGADGSMGPLVKVADRPRAHAGWLDSAADPRTLQGAARARHLPVWTPDFDAAFPPAVCGSAWEHDAIAVPTPGTDVGAYGDPAAMAALAVMRYEHLVSRALAAPSVLAQLCVAVAAVDPARSEALSRLVPLIGDDPGAGLPIARDLLATPCAARTGHSSGGGDAAGTPDTTGDACTATFPRTVFVVALSPSAAVAAACTAAGDGTSALLRAYELVPARGIEDAVVDVAYRVSRISERSAAGCAGEAAWFAEWEQRAHEWLAQGQVWLPVGAAVTAEGLCAEASAADAGDCPEAWSQ